MIVIELHLLAFIFTSMIVNTSAGRCYLCSQTTLTECAGSNQPDSSIYTTVLQYYTEPCNGQCVLFRNENNSIIRGCSWTYGHMTAKSIGWHDISPGIKAYFCDSHLCNNGTYEQPEISMMRIGTIDNQFILSPQQLFVLAGNNPSLMYPDAYLPRQLRQCYSCTARFKGCGEFLDPQYVSNYIRPCTSSCIVFRNPNDLNLITRDCSTSWPQIHAKSGLHKLLGSDAFFCQESLCNGISFDFIMGIFHNQLSAVLTFPPIEDTPTTMRTTLNVDNDNIIWDDPDLDFILVNSTTIVVPNNLTTSIPIDHFDFIDEIFPSSTIVGGQNLSLNWWDLNDTSLSISPLTSTPISSSIDIEEDDWVIFNASSIPAITRFEHLSVDEDSEEINQVAKHTESNSEIDEDMNDYIRFPALIITTPTIDSVNSTRTFLPYYSTDNKTKDQILESTLVMPSFSSILKMAAENNSEFQSGQNSTTAKQKVQLQTTTSKPSTIFYEYCKNKQCYYGGRLNSDCLCICLPTFTGDNCETILCDEEPAHICNFVLEHECESDYVRYLCPKFCQMNMCSTKKM